MENSGHLCNGPIAQLDKLANLAAVTLFSDTDNMIESTDSGLDSRSHMVTQSWAGSTPPTLPMGTASF